MDLTLGMIALALSAGDFEVDPRVLVLPPLTVMASPNGPVILAEDADQAGKNSLIDPIFRTALQVEPPALVGPVIPVEEAPLLPVPSRWSARHDFGDGVGFQRGFTYLEAFVPVFQPRPDAVLFVDLRAVNFDLPGRWQFSGGSAFRTYSPKCGLVFGANAFYDGRLTDTRYFNQLGVGSEILGRFFEARGNGYIVLGQNRQQIFDSGFVSQGVVNGNQVLQRLQICEMARSGFDCEVGGPLPLGGLLYPRFYAGYYYFTATRAQPINGVRGRLEAQIGRYLTAHLSVQNDAVFNTTVYGGLAVHFGGPAFRSAGGTPTLTDILGQRVVRDFMVITRTEHTTQQVIPPPPQPAPPPIDGEEEPG